MRLSVIVPALNEEHEIERTLRHARQPGVSEIIVVDGGSTDRTCARAAARADRVLAGPRGRASQMNAGAAAAEGDVLLFLHADTIVPEGYAAAVERALAAPEVCGGRFDIELQPTSPLLWLTGTLINVRSRWSRIATGDQAIFVRRQVFERLGGYPELPLMEDIALSTALRRMGTVACLRERVTTSSRRWAADGVVRTILLMWWLRFLYYVGVSPVTLRRMYLDRR